MGRVGLEGLLLNGGASAVLGTESSKTIEAIEFGDNEA